MNAITVPAQGQGFHRSGKDARLRTNEGDVATPANDSAGFVSRAYSVWRAPGTRPRGVPFAILMSEMTDGPSRSTPRW